MTHVRTCSILAAWVFIFVLAGTPSAHAQQPSGPTNVISANPFGLLLEFFNAEWEHVVSRTSTAGIGGSFIDIDENDFVNVDAFWRLYPQGNPLDGWAFGAKVGMTRVDGEGYFGFGFDANRSWLLGVEENFYVGIGIGLKRLLGASDEEFEPRFIPTIRIVNVGYAF